MQTGPCNFVISDRETRTQSGLINHLTFRGWKVAVEYFSLISLCFGDTFYQLSMMNLSRLFKLRSSLQHSLVEHSSSNIMQCMGAWVRGDMKFLCKCLTRDHTSESSEIFYFIFILFHFLNTLDMELSTLDPRPSTKTQTLFLTPKRFKIIES